MSESKPTKPRTVCPECGRDRSNREPHKPNCIFRPPFLMCTDVLRRSGIEEAADALRERYMEDLVKTRAGWLL